MIINDKLLNDKTYAFACELKNCQQGGQYLKYKVVDDGEDEHIVWGIRLCKEHLGTNQEII